MAAADAIGVARTVGDLFAAAVARHPDRPALRAACAAAPALTWAGYDARMRTEAARMADLGVRHGEPVALLLTNRIEFHVVDAALMHIGAVPFSIYATSAPRQVAELIADSGARVLVSEARFDDVLGAVAGRIDHVVRVDAERPHVPALSRDEIAARARAIDAGDLLTIIYTSGTTGAPKAVEITHANMLAELQAIEEAVPGQDGGAVISWLPAAHLAERWASQYSAMAYAREVACLDDPRGILDALPVERPVRFGAVPRTWEKLRARLEAEIAGWPEPRRAAARRAIEAGVAVVRAEQAGRPASPEERAAAQEGERTVFPELRRLAGLDRARMCTTGAAPTSTDVLELFMAIGIPICEQWGMSETSCIATLNRPDAVRIGTAGTPLPGVEVRLAGDGELLVRGPIVTRGYRGRPDLTAAAIDGDGWLRTGDIAVLDEDGYVRIVDRKKDLIINASGKNMSPAAIEAQLKAASPLIGQACCIGDGRPHNTALLVLDPDGARAFAREHGLPTDRVADLARDPVALAAVEAAVGRANARLSRVEQIRRWAVLDAEWQPGGDELTPTMKLKRRPIVAKYADRIDRLYEAEHVE